MNSNSTETWQIKLPIQQFCVGGLPNTFWGLSCNPTPNVRFTSWSIFNDGDLLHSLVSLPLRQSAYNLFTGVVMLECGHYVEESLSPSVPPLVIVSRVADHKSPRAEGEKSKTFANREMVALGWKRVRTNKCLICFIVTTDRHAGQNAIKRHFRVGSTAAARDRLHDNELCMGLLNKNQH